MSPADTLEALAVEFERRAAEHRAMAEHLITQGVMSSGNRRYYLAQATQECADHIRLEIARLLREAGRRVDGGTDG